MDLEADVLQLRFHAIAYRPQGALIGPPTFHENVKSLLVTMAKVLACSYRQQSTYEHSQERLSCDGATLLVSELLHRDRTRRNREEHRAALFVCDKQAPPGSAEEVRVCRSCVSL